jgi:hypothetical protein
MKCCLTVIFLTLLAAGPARAQVRSAVPLERAEALGVDLARLDSLNGPAAHADSSLSVFPKRQDEVFDAWSALLESFSSHLQKRGFTWSRPLRGYYRFYFRPDGTIETVLYRARGLEGARAAQYQRALETFAQSHRFALSADEGFRQCGPAVLTPPADGAPPSK